MQQYSQLGDGTKMCMQHLTPRPCMLPLHQAAFASTVVSRDFVVVVRGAASKYPSTPYSAGAHEYCTYASVSTAENVSEFSHALPLSSRFSMGEDVVVAGHEPSSAQRRRR